MSALLIRGLSPKVRKWLQKMASRENLSLNQAVVKVISTAVDEWEEKQEMEERREEAFQRLEKLRAETYKKYGKFDDSTKIIREMRDTRHR